MNNRSKILRNNHVSRRTILRGAGVAMCLPWLESIPVFGADGVTAGAASVAPKRLAVLFMANGVNPNHWTAEGTGDEMVLGKGLEPLEPHKAKLNFIKGLFNKAATNVGIHPGMTGNLLSGARLQKGAELRGGISFDQVLANRIGDQTIQPSMVLGCEQPVTGYHETNFSMAYGSHISWQNETSPVPMEVYPSLAFDSLFDNKGSKRHQSVLDRVRDEATDLSRQVSVGDRIKLDEYLTSVREIEKRAQGMRLAKEKADLNAAGKEPIGMLQRPDSGLPEDIREHMRLMCDILALAFQTDRTRLATLLLCRDISGLFYPFLDVRNAHHLASHQDTSDGFLRINQYYMGQLAYLTSKLESMREGERSVLDNSCLVFMSNMWSGSNHDASKVPVLTVGNLQGSLETGRVLDYTKSGDENRKLCSFYLSLMDRMGVELPRFGDASARLSNL